MSGHGTVNARIATLVQTIEAVKLGGIAEDEA